MSITRLITNEWQMFSFPHLDFWNISVHQDFHFYVNLYNEKI